MLQTFSTVVMIILYGAFIGAIVTLTVSAIKHIRKEIKKKPKPERMTEGTRFYARQSDKLIACKLTKNHQDIEIIHATRLNGGDAIRVEYSEVESIM